MGYCKNVFSSILIVIITLRGIETEFVLTGATCTVANGFCKTSCECKEGFIKFKELCVGKIGTQCSMTTDCIPDAICGNYSGRMNCECRDGFKEELNNTECHLKVGSPCKVTAAQYCINNADCDVTSGTCTCKKGYSTKNNNNECLGNAEIEADLPLWIIIFLVTGWTGWVVAIGLGLVLYRCCCTRCRKRCRKLEKQPSKK